MNDGKGGIIYTDEQLAEHERREKRATPVNAKALEEQAENDAPPVADPVPPEPSETLPPEKQAQQAARREAGKKVR